MVHAELHSEPSLPTIAARPQNGTARILFVNRFAQPDISATAQILSQVSTALANKGHDVEVITSRTFYSDPTSRLPRHQTIDGVAINRIWTSRMGRSHLIGRLFDYISFYISSFFSVLKHAQKGDIVVSKTDPPLLGAITGIAATIKGARKVNWLQDLYPEVASRLGVSLLNGKLGKLLSGIRNMSLRSADMNIAIGNKMADLLEGLGTPSEKVTVHTNFSRDDEIKPLSEEAVNLRHEWGFSTDDFIVGYSGNLGRAHDVDTAIEAAKLLSHKKTIKFLFVGGGFAKETVTQAIRNHDLTNVVFQPYQPESRLAESLSVPDLHWMSLIPSMEGLIVPSKFYGIAAVGRPVLMVGDPTGEIGTIITQNDCGYVVSPNEGEQFAEIVSTLQNNRAKGAKLGRNSRQYLETHASRQRIFDLWHELVLQLNT